MSPAVLLAALLAVLIWSGSPVATKFALADLSPFHVALLRTVLGGIAALPIAAMLRIPWPKQRLQSNLLLLSSFCGFIAFPLAFSLGMRLTSAVHGIMILALLPLTTGAIAFAWERRWPSWLWWLGSAIALLGEGVVTISRITAPEGRASIAGDSILLLSTLAAASGYVAGGRLQQTGYPAKGATFWGVALMAMLLTPVLAWSYAGIDWRSVSLPAWGGVLYLAFGVTIVGYLCWYWALGHGGIARTSLLQFLQPVSGVVLAWALLSEPINLGVWCASILIIAGVAIATRRS
jgi:drug/metabolite transporter (DMT)-like permease